MRLQSQAGLFAHQGGKPTASAHLESCSMHASGPAWHSPLSLQELVQRCGANPKYEEVAREEGGAARVHAKVAGMGVQGGEGDGGNMPTLAVRRFIPSALAMHWRRCRPAACCWGRACFRPPISGGAWESGQP